MNEDAKAASRFYLGLSMSKFETEAALQAGLLSYLRNIYMLKGVGCKLASLNRRFGVQSKALGKPLKDRILTLIDEGSVSVNRHNSSTVVVPEPEHAENMKLYQGNPEVLQTVANAVFENAE